jgi:hypothetical protein
MPVWHITVNLSDLNNRWHKGEIDIPELAKLVVERIKQSKWRDITPYPHTFGDALAELEAVTSKDEYVAVFEELYDLADSDRVCIETSV